MPLSRWSFTLRHAAYEFDICFCCRAAYCRHAEFTQHYAVIAWHFRHFYWYWCLSLIGWYHAAIRHAYVISHSRLLYDIDRLSSRFARWFTCTGCHFGIPMIFFDDACRLSRLIPLLFHWMADTDCRHADALPIVGQYVWPLTMPSIYRLSWSYWCRRCLIMLPGILLIRFVYFGCRLIPSFFCHFWLAIYRHLMPRHFSLVCRHCLIIFCLMLISMLSTLIAPSLIISFSWFPRFCSVFYWMRCHDWMISLYYAFISRQNSHSLRLLTQSH